MTGEGQLYEKPIGPTMTNSVAKRLAATGGRLGCPHPVHRMATVDNSPASLILPECAGREAWLAARKGGIGGSEVGALIGVNEYETAFSIFNKKTRTDPDTELTGGPIEWGHRFEDAVAEKTAEMIGLASRFGGGLWADREKPHLRVTPDRFATKPRSWRAVGVIESKTAGDDEHWTSGNITVTGQGTGSAPLSYQCQTQWQMGIIGVKKAWLGCHISNRARDFYVVEIDFNPGWFAEMVHGADSLWFGNVLTGEPPMHDLRHPKTEEMLKAISPNVVVPSVQLPEDAGEWAKDLKAAQAAEKEATARVDEIKNYFRMHMADAGAGYLGDQKIVSYPEVRTSGIDVAKLREDFPEVAEQVTRVSHYRRMTVKAPK